MPFPVAEVATRSVSVRLIRYSRAIASLSILFATLPGEHSLVVGAVPFPGARRIYLTRGKAGRKSLVDEGGIQRCLLA